MDFKILVRNIVLNICGNDNIIDIIINNSVWRVYFESYDVADGFARLLKTKQSYNYYLFMYSVSFDPKIFIKRVFG